MDVTRSSGFWYIERANHLGRVRFVRAAYEFVAGDGIVATDDELIIWLIVEGQAVPGDWIVVDGRAIAVAQASSQT